MRSQIAVVSLGSSLDHSTGAQLQAKVRLALSEKLFLVLDALELAFIDSAGIAQIFAAVKLAARAGGDVAIIGANQQMKVLFALVQLDRVVHICADIAIAMELLKAAGLEPASQLKSPPGVPIYVTLG